MRSPSSIRDVRVRPSAVALRLARLSRSSGRRTVVVGTMCQEISYIWQYVLRGRGLAWPDLIALQPRHGLRCRPRLYRRIVDDREGLPAAVGPELFHQAVLHLENRRQRAAQPQD